MITAAIIFWALLTWGVIGLIALLFVKLDSMRMRTRFLVTFLCGPFAWAIVIWMIWKFRRRL